jgi:hypothetical protein
MEVLSLEHTNVCIVSAYLKKKIARFTVKNRLILNGLHQIPQDLMHETCFEHKERGLVWWKFPECRKEIQTSGVIRQAI